MSNSHQAGETTRSTETATPPRISYKQPNDPAASQRRDGGAAALTYAVSSTARTCWRDQLSGEYGAAIGSVMDARKQYETACAAQGSDSCAAQQAHDDLLREIEHRNEMRERYDAAAGERTGR